MDGVHLLLNVVRVQVVAVHQAPPPLHSTVNLVLVGLHGTHKVLVLLQGLLCPSQRVRCVHVGQRVLLEEPMRRFKDN